ncbi:hypothetical protein DEU32_102166 [Curtobacterium sp. AG1037]|uniref:hypothetical protein n=1 Tax=Curtobacterium sp. AG1037 TaxID=2183990 RepID=UPI000E0A1D39|nr:hypothetical protein [Curtobacterium sp. AG1037]RDI01138.1 hypothetical protein DEU32_102166 [Curtobacterium sp. AG1037]
MTNDDRSNEDRTGDGRAPSWGEAPQHGSADRAGDLPRHGERDDAPRYGQRSDERADAPRYGERSDAPRWGEQHGDRDGRPADSPTWGEQHGSHQPYAAAAAPTSANAPAWQSYDEPKRKKKTAGVVAFVVAIVALVVGVIGGYLFGSAIATSQAFEEVLRNGGDANALGPDAFRDLQGNASIIAAALLFVLGTVLGLWAIIQAIVAMATGRGRVWGVLALVIAVVGVFAFVVTYSVVAGASVMGG